MKNFKILIALFLIGLVTACNDNFLDVVPETSIGVENFFNTEEDLNIYVNSLYNFPGSGIYYADGGTDNAATTGNTEIKTMMVSTASSSTITSGWNWGALRSINLFLENFDKANISQEKLNHFEGLGRFFRAQFYYDKVKRYSDVPYYDFVIETGDTEALNKPRDSREMVVDKVFEDYQFAIENIFENQPDGAVNRWVAKAFMARNALHEGTFRKYHSELNLTASADKYLKLARDIAKDIMDNGPFSIKNTGNSATDYSSLFNSTDLESNPEVILGVYSLDQVKNSGWSETVFGNYETSPAKDLLQSYLMADGSYYSNQANYDEFSFVQEFQNRDPRLSQTYAYPGFVLVNSRTYSQGAGMYVQQLAKNFSGYHQLKGFVNVTDQATINNLDFPVLRFAETLLIYAEAKAELNEMNQTVLNESINLLRDRAGMPALTMGVTVDPVLQAKYPTVSDPVLLEIRRERRVELALEGYRFDDLMRWKVGKLLEEEPRGLYFSGLGKHDVTGDGIEDIILLDASASIPDTKERNALDVPFAYYRVGSFGENVGVFLSDGNSGHILTVIERGTFDDPKFYYRPVPAAQVALNPNLTQIFGWN
ncbi:RagB/SusD family nutrient uptake outer membrane protein [Roseivirga seohaensis]|uniref:RagB/SusD family nutrient uptake outer membrane protein n=1 Tax=Roseivirga seohaensis TaxID=1914963 RepID=UPI003BAC68F9